MTEKLPDKRSPSQAIKAFLRQSQKLPVRTDSSVTRPGRLIFSLDATASRQPTWDRACHLHSEMFTAAASTGGLCIQLCYYRGYRDFYASPWVDRAETLFGQMTAVECLGGFTQIRRLLKHALSETQREKINALVFIGDALEEPVDATCQLAGECGLRGLPLFVFQEGDDPDVRLAFQQMARLSKGAYAHFDGGSAEQLAELLRAVATYASGGVEALRKLNNASAQKLLTQL